MNNGIKGKDIISSIILLGILIFGSVQLYEIKDLSEASLVSLLCASGIFSSIVLFNRRIKKAGATGLELYEKIEEKEKSIKRLAEAILELAESNEGGIMVESWNEGRYEEAKQRIKQLM